MEENVESKVVKEKLDKAFKKLWTLDRLDQKSLRTSKYNFGVEKPFINDRGTFYIKLGASTIKCTTSEHEEPIQWILTMS